jgi:hypothetical protein
MNKNVFLAAMLSALAAAAHSQADGSLTPSGRNQLVPDAPSTAADGARGSMQSVEPAQKTLIVRGTVEGIDPQNRLFALQGPGGKTALIYAGENLQNFEKLKLGEQATVRYTETTVLAISRKGVFARQRARFEPQRADGPSPQLSSRGSAQKMRPRTSMFGKVSDIDLGNSNITVENDDGQKIEMHASDEQAIAGLYIGERILVTYAEAIALSIQPD